MGTDIADNRGNIKNHSARAAILVAMTVHRQHANLVGHHRILRPELVEALFVGQRREVLWLRMAPDIKRYKGRLAGSC